MYKASKREFLRCVNKAMGDYVKGHSGQKMILVHGPYVVELYKNIKSSYRRRNTPGQKGAISIWEKVGDQEYTIKANHVFGGIEGDTKNAKDGLSDAKNLFIDIRENPQSQIENFIKKYKF